jgi:hypothetical protein
LTGPGSPKKSCSRPHALQLQIEAGKWGAGGFVLVASVMLLVGKQTRRLARSRFLELSYGHIQKALCTRLIRRFQASFLVAWALCQSPTYNKLPDYEGSEITSRACKIVPCKLMPTPSNRLIYRQHGSAIVCTFIPAAAAHKSWNKAINLIGSSYSLPTAFLRYLIPLLD